ncbi:MAG: hypothetical protein A2W38_02205 [Deltaproteobacteria bacterium RBG_19FT_COMBO_58_16]|nr:MAG: hypothetical protein A2W38_02205 [Deltaproteobacteria bacterium RBG_19FT_COMBO_58_16]
MIGAVIITHGRLADCLVSVAESISGKIENVRVVPVMNSDKTENIRVLLSKAIKEIDSGDGVLIFTDMFGGTPTNIALSLMEEGKVDIITGVNLPIILKFVSYRNDKTLSELAALLKDYGHTSIVLAGDMLKEKK